MQKSNFLKNNAFVNRVSTETLPPGSRSNVMSKRNSVRPETPDSDDSSYEGKLTRDQHTCIQNVGMATACVLPIALVAGGVAVGTNYWFNIMGDYVGLFRYCNNWTSDCFDISNRYGNDTTLEQMWKIGVPLELSGLGLLMVGMACLICYPCHRRINFSKMACATVIAIIILLGTLLFVGGTVAFTVYYTKEKPDLEWSFYINAAAAGLAFVATIMFWVHLFYTGCFDMD